MRLFQAFYRLFKEQASRAHGVCIGTSAVLLYSHRQKVMCEDRRAMLAAVNILHTLLYISYFYVLSLGLQPSHMWQAGCEACNSVGRPIMLALHSQQFAITFWVIKKIALRSGLRLLLGISPKIVIFWQSFWYVLSQYKNPPFMQCNWDKQSLVKYPTR